MVFLEAVLAFIRQHYKVVVFLLVIGALYALLAMVSSLRADLKTAQDANTKLAAETKTLTTSLATAKLEAKVNKESLDNLVTQYGRLADGLDTSNRQSTDNYRKLQAALANMPDFSKLEGGALAKETLRSLHRQDKEQKQ